MKAIHHLKCFFLQITQLVFISTGRCIWPSITQLKKATAKYWTSRRPALVCLMLEDKASVVCMEHIGEGWNTQIYPASLIRTEVVSCSCLKSVYRVGILGR